MSHSRQHGIRAIFGLGGIALIFFGVSLYPRSVRGEARSTEKAEDLVREALHCEIYGQARQRALLLDEAIQRDPQYKPAKWHRGLVHFQGRWVSAEAVPQMLDDDPRYAEYFERRTKASDSIDDQVVLAKWCRKQGLNDQERAHLFRVLDKNPNHREARKRLGFRQVSGRWILESDREAIKKQRDRLRKTVEKWRPRLREVRSALDRGDDKRREKVLAEIGELHDPSAIPAFELLLSAHSMAAALLVVDWLNAMPEAEASLSLTRHAILSPWSEVRQAAIMALKDRPMNDYVPALLDSLYSPIVPRMVNVSGPGRTLVHRVELVREGRERREAVILDTRYRRVARRRGDAVGTFWNTLWNIGGTDLAITDSVAARNRRTMAWNSRVGQLLAAVSGREISSDPTRWWDWWSQETERELAGRKPLRTTRSVRQVAMVDRVPRGAQRSSRGSQFSGQGSVSGFGGSTTARSHECLAKGTPVWTARGFTSIEKIEIGDLVLSQHPETGELAMKPVLRTTVRPKTALVRVAAGDEQITTTGGHLFWVAGDGWIKARRLRPGTQLHGQSGGVPVRWVEPAEEAETYNLEVADFRTYFVGKQRILTHDFVEPRPTSATVPGLVGTAR